MAEIVTSVLLTVEPDLGHASGGRGIWNQYHGVASEQNYACLRACMIRSHSTIRGGWFFYAIRLGRWDGYTASSVCLNRLRQAGEAVFFPVEGGNQ